MRNHYYRQGNISEACVFLLTGGLYIISLPVWLPGPMFLVGVSVQRGFSVQVVPVYEVVVWGVSVSVQGVPV